MEEKMKSTIKKVIEVLTNDKVGNKIMGLMGLGYSRSQAERFIELFASGKGVDVAVSYNNIFGGPRDTWNESSTGRFLEKTLNNPEKLADAVRREPGKIRVIPDDKLTEAICEIAVKKDPETVRYVPVDKMTASIIEAVGEDGRYIDLIPADLWTGRIWESVVKKDICKLKYVPAGKYTDCLRLYLICDHPTYASRYIPIKDRTLKLCADALMCAGIQVASFVPKEMRESAKAKAAKQIVDLLDDAIDHHQYMRHSYWWSGDNGNWDARRRRERQLSCMYTFYDDDKEVVIDQDVSMSRHNTYYKMTIYIDGEVTKNDLRYLRKLRKKYEDIASCSPSRQ